MITSLDLSTELAISPAHSCPKSRKKDKPKRCRGRNDVKTPPRMITSERLRALKADMDVNTLRITMQTPTLPPSFFNLFKYLRVLDLRKVGLEKLPPQIIELVNLQKLDLRYNQLPYLPSQIAQLPNLHHLQMEDVRNRRTKLLKEIDVIDQGNTTGDSTSKICTCLARTDGQLIPPLPTLTQLCTRLILSTILPTASDDPDDLSWEDLEPWYTTGKLDEQRSDPVQIPFPSHLLPTQIPYDICSGCCEAVLPAHAQFERIQVVALCRVRLRYVFCSHKCFSEVVERWEVERTEDLARKRLRETRFRVKEIEE